MSTDAISSTQGTQAAQPHHHHHGRAHKVLDSAAKAFGMSDDDLKAELKSGKSLQDVAKQKGGLNVLA